LHDNNQNLKENDNGYELCLFVDYSPLRKVGPLRKDEFYHHSDIHLAKGPQEILRYLHSRFGSSMKAVEFIEDIDEPEMRKILSEHLVYEGSEQRSILKREMEAVLYLAHVNRRGGVKGNGVYAQSKRLRLSP
jgi:hypothetical protein